MILNPDPKSNVAKMTNNIENSPQPPSVVTF